MAIRLAVIGAGRIGQIHASNAARNPGVQLAGIADAIPEAAQKLAAQLDAPVVSVDSFNASSTRRRTGDASALKTRSSSALWSSKDDM